MAEDFKCRASIYPFVSTRSVNRPRLHPERNPQDESANSRQPTHLAAKRKKYPRVRAILSPTFTDGELTEILFLLPFFFFFFFFLFSPFPRPPSSSLAVFPAPSQTSPPRGVDPSTWKYYSDDRRPLRGWLDDWIAPARLSRSSSSSVLCSRSCWFPRGGIVSQNNVLRLAVKTCRAENRSSLKCWDDVPRASRMFRNSFSVSSMFKCNPGRTNDKFVTFC